MAAGSTIDSEEFLVAFQGSESTAGGVHGRNGAISGNVISNSTSNTVITGTAQDDTIENSGSNVSIIGGAGDDSIFVQHSSNIAISGNEGSDIISLDNSNYISVDAGAGNDTVNSYSDNVTLDGGAGNDFINNDGNPLGGTRNALINGGAGDDRIENSGSSDATIYGGDGADSIYNNGSDVYIDGGNGHDSIYNAFANDATIIGGAGNDTVVNDASGGGERFSILGGAGDDNLSGYGNYATMDGGADNDFISNGGNNSMLLGGTGNDTISNTGSSVRVYAGTGNDSISNTSGEYVTIDGGDGDDSIRTGSPYSLGANGTLRGFVYGGEGNDYVYNANALATINGGNDNDTINNQGDVVFADGGAGDDYISNIVKINYAGQYVTLSGGDGKDTIINNGSHNSISGGAGDDSIVSSSYKINGSNFTASVNYNTINGGAGNDTVSLSSTYNLIQYASGDGKDVIYGLNSNDTLHITGGTVYSSISNGSDFILYVGQFDGLGDNGSIYVNKGSITLKEGVGKTINLKIGSNAATVVSLCQTSNAIDMPITELPPDVTTVPGTTGDDTIYNTVSGATINALAGNDHIVNFSGSDVIINAGAGNDFIEIQGDDNVWADGGAGNDTICAYDGTNSTIIGGKDNDTIYLNNGSDARLIQYAAGDGNDVIYGWSSFDTLHITSGSVGAYSVSGNDVILNFSSGSVTLKDMKGKAFNLKIGNASVITKEVTKMENYEDNSRVNGTSDSDEIYNVSYGSTINAGAGDDNIDNSGDENLINGGNGNDYISSYGESNIINGGTGSDEISFSGDSNYVDGGTDDDYIATEYTAYSTINGGTGDDTIEISGYGNEIDGGTGNDVIAVYGDEEGNTVSGGTGDDLFIFNGGELTITDYEEGDTIQANFAFTSEDISYEFDGTGVWVSIGEEGAIFLQNVYDEDELANVVLVDDEFNPVVICIKPDDYIYVFDGGEMTIDEYIEGETIKLTFGFEDVTSKTDDEGGVTFTFDGENTLYISNGAEFMGEEIWEINFVDWDGESIEIPVEGVDPYITLTNNADNYTNYTENATIEALNGNDVIINDVADNVQIDLGAGNDSLYSNYSWYMTIYGGAGADTVQDYRGSRNLIDMGDGHDVVSMSAATGAATVIGGAGNDTIINANTIGSVYQYANGHGADVITGFNDNDTLHITSGSISGAVANGDDVVLTVGTGTITLKDKVDETIHYKLANGSVQSTVISSGFKFTDGDDSYTNNDDGVTLSALAGNDSIWNYGEDVTINGDAGDDHLDNRANNVTMSGGAGNDLLWNDTYNDGANNVSLSGGTGADSITNFGNNVTMNGDAGNDYLKNDKSDDGADSVLINGGADNDFIFNFGTNSTLLGGDGADTIGNYQKGYRNGILLFDDGGENVLIDGGSGNDSIQTNAVGGTIIGGAGHDTILLTDGESNLIRYANGDGNDIINGFGLTDTLQITNGSYTAEISGSNWIITVGSGKITLNGAAENDYVLLKDASGKLVTLTREEPLPAGWKYNNTAKTVVTATVATAEDLDLNEGYGVKVTKVDASKITGGVEIIGNDNDVSIKTGKGADTVTGGIGDDTVSLGAGADLYIYTGGNDVFQDFANGDTVQLADGIEIGDVSTVGSNVIIDTSEGTIMLKGGKSKEIRVIDDSGDTVYPLGPTLPAGWGYNSAKTIVTATIAGAEKYLDLTEDYGEGVEKVDGSKITTGAEIIAHDEGVSIKAGKGADTVTGGAGDDTVSLGAGADVYVFTGGDDIIQDYGTGADRIQINTANYEFVGTEADTIGTSVTYTLKDKDENEGTITLIKGTNKTVTFIDENGETVDPYPPDSLYVPGTTGKDTLVEGRDSVTIDAFAGDDIITSSGNEASINAGAGKDKISLTGGENITVYGGAGNDTIWNASDGSNVYEYNVGSVADGKDTIVGYNEGDTIYIDGGIYRATTVGGNWQITIGSGNSNVITLKDAADKIVTVVDSAGNIDTLAPIEPLPSGWAYGNSAKTQVKATLAAANEIDLNESYGNGVTTVDGSKITAGADITGNDKGNSIKGGRGADIITGGTGDDTISLGGGADTYVFNGGMDIIQDFGSGADVIQISDTANITLEAVETVGNNIVITTSEGSITLNKAKGKNVTIYGASESETLYPTIPVVDGWQFTNSGQVAKATVAAPEDLDLNEAYGKAVVTVDGSKATSGLNIIGNDEGNYIKTSRGDDCIIGGVGNDTVSLGGGLDVYVYQGGEDLIQDYMQGADTIKVDTTNFEITTAETVGSNFEFTFNGGDGKLTIKNGKGKEIVVVDQDDVQIYPTIEPLPKGWSYVNAGLGTKVTATAPDDLNLTEGYGAGVMTVDASASKVSVEIIGNDDGNSIKGSKYADVITGGTGDDIISLGGGSDTYVYGGGNDTIQDFATIDAIQFTEDVAYESAADSGNNYVFTTSLGTITIVNGKAKKDKIFVYDFEGEQIHPDPVPTIAGWQVNGDLAKATVSSAESSVDFTDISDVKKIDASKISYGVEIIGNDEGNSIKGGKGADEIKGGLGNDTVSLGGGADVYIYTGGDDYIQDYGVGNDSIQFTSDVTFDAQSTVGNDVVLTTNVGNVTIKSGKPKDIVVMNESGERIHPTPEPEPLPNGWKYNTNKTQIIASVTAPDDLDLMDGGYGDGVTTIDGSKATAGVNIIGNDEGTSIKGGRGADCIVGGLGNDIVSLGGGADVYVYTGGEDLIQDYNAVDTLVLGTNEYALTAIETVSTNVIYTFNNGEGKVTVKGGKGKNITFVDENDDPLEEKVLLPDGWNYTNNNAKLVATVASAEDLDLNESYGEGVATVDASKITGGVEVIAHDNGVSIKSGKGADTIWGGAGNDTVSLGGGADVFVYQGGEDLIQDYAAADRIQFNTGDFAIDAVSTVSSNVIYTFANDAGTLTIKGGKGKTISFIDMNGNAISAGVSGRSAMAADDLFADDNFIGGDAQIADISEITATNYSVGKVETGTVELAQDTLGAALAYSQEK